MLTPQTSGDALLFYSHGDVSRCRERCERISKTQMLTRECLVDDLALSGTDTESSLADMVQRSRRRSLGSHVLLLNDLAKGTIVCTPKRYAEMLAGK